MDRDYVIVCNRHRGVVGGCLLFWGHYTEDDQERSFGGYTSDIDKCEKYTLEEAKNRYDFPAYDKRMTFRSFRMHDDVIIKVSDLVVFGYKPIKLMALF